MTNREFYNAIATNEALSAELTEFAAEAIVKLDAGLAKRREKNAEKADAAQVYVDQLVGFLGSEPRTATMLLCNFNDAGVTEVDGKALTVQRVSSWARKAVAAESAAQVDVKIPGKGAQKGYVLVGADAE